MRCAHDCPHVGRAHRVLQTACGCHEACWKEYTRHNSRQHQESRLQNQRQPVEGLPARQIKAFPYTAEGPATQDNSMHQVNAFSHKQYHTARLILKSVVSNCETEVNNVTTSAELPQEVHLVLVDQETAGVCSSEEGEHKEAGLSQGLCAILTLLVSLQSESDVGRAASDVGGIETPGLKGNDIGCTSAGGQAPAEPRHPELGALEALPDGCGLPWLHAEPTCEGHRRIITKVASTCWLCVGALLRTRLSWMTLAELDLESRDGDSGIFSTVACGTCGSVCVIAAGMTLETGRCTMLLRCETRRLRQKDMKSRNMHAGSLEAVRACHECMLKTVLFSILEWVRGPVASGDSLTMSLVWAMHFKSPSRGQAWAEPSLQGSEWPPV